MNNMENSGYKVFLDLQNREHSDEGYILVESVPFSIHHKIGISNDGFPLFFVKCDNETKSIDINLELISVERYARLLIYLALFLVLLLNQCKACGLNY